MGDPVNPVWSKTFRYDSNMAILRPEAIAWISNVRSEIEETSVVANSAASSFLRLSESSQALSSVSDAISKQLQTMTETSMRDLLYGSFKAEKKMTQSAYPAVVETVSLDHKGGTKSYAMTIVKGANGRSLVIFRWGKTGAFGEIMVDRFNTVPEAEKVFDKKLTEKLKKGYEVNARIDPKPVRVSDFEEFRKAIGRPLMSKLGPADIKHIDEDVDTTGIREREEPRLTEDAVYDQNAAARKEAEMKERARKEREKLKLQEQQEIESVYKTNPNFGAF